MLTACMGIAIMCPHGALKLHWLVGKMKLKMFWLKYHCYCLGSAMQVKACYNSLGKMGENGGKRR